MMPLLIILLAVSLTFIVAGYLLSSRSATYNQRAASYDERRVRRPVRPGASVNRSMERPVALRRSSVTLSATAMSMAAQSPGKRRSARQPSWKIMTIGLVSLTLLGLYLLNLLLPHQGFLGYYLFNTAPAVTPASQSVSPVYHAFQITRISQLDPAQYNSPQEYHTWAYAACSAAAMAVVIDAYGHRYRVIDILSVESRMGEITPQMGLLEDSGIARTLAQFGFKASWGYQLNLDQVIATANKGQPVIVDFPPDRFAGGHLLVVTGGTADSVFLADSSGLNMRTMARARFLQLWGGFSAVATPR
ncbi:MAG: C39 family peptidase [Chloroflexota bacterium]|nr:C39 family peptidase [Chloroflexota bacterium]